MASSKNHLYCNWVWLGIVGLIYTYLTLDYLTIIYIPVAVYWGAIIPDSDQKWKYDTNKIEKLLYSGYHRHWWYHSVIPNVLIWLGAMLVNETHFIMLTAFMMLGTGLHLLADCHVRRKRMIGTYCIKLYKTLGKMKGLSGMESTIWLFLNFTCSVLLFGVSVWRVA